jgi:hypothetical protein
MEMAKIIDRVAVLVAALAAGTCGGRSVAQGSPHGTPDVKAQTAPTPLVASAQPGTSDPLQTLQWRGKTKSLEIRAVNGPVRAVLSTDDQVEIVARVTKNKHEKAHRLHVVEKGALTLACVVVDHPSEGYDERGGDEDDAEDCGHSGFHRGTGVDVLVKVPKGVKFAGWTVNGSVEAEGLQGDVEAHTQNGTVRIETTGIARASTVNGSIRAKLGATSWDGTVALESVNGRLDVELPSGVGALLRADTVHGSVRVAPRMDAAKIEENHVEGRLGKGGGELHLRTVNGPIEVR